MSDETVAAPTAAQVTVAGLIELPNATLYEKIQAAALAITNGYNVVTYNGKTFPLITTNESLNLVWYSNKNYQTPKVVPPVVVPPVVVPPIIPTFNITYNGNGNTGGADPIDPINYSAGNTGVVLGFFTLVKIDDVFVSWNTEANGSGTSYVPNAGITVSSDITLYAQWETSPAVGALTAVSNSDTTSTVSWTNFTPVSIGRNGVDSTGGGPWSTTTIVGTSQTFTLLIPGDTYEFTATNAAGTILNAQVTLVAAPTSTTLPVGINNTGTVIWDTSTNAALCAQAKTLGAKFGRTSIPWNCTQGSSEWGTLFTSATDLSLNQASVARIKALVADAEAAGLQMIFCTVGYVGEGATAPAIANDLYATGYPFSPQAYANILTELVAAVPGLWIEHINEWDLYEYSYDANSPITVPAYAALLQASYAPMKKADPTCKVLTGPLANINAGNEDGWTLLNDLYDLLPNWFDLVDADSIHGVYPWPNNLSASQAGVVGWVQTWLALRASKGNTKPWYITEGGFQSLTTGSGNGLPEMTPASQSADLVQLIQELEQFVSQGLQAFLIYCLDEDDYWGLIDSSGNEKPSFSAIAALIKGN
jgi:hypothetical protein